MRSTLLARLAASSSSSSSSSSLAVRRLSTHPRLCSLHPCIRDVVASLARQQPCFALPARDVRVLTDPAHFYATLLDIVRRARSRIFLSSLYIGPEERDLTGALDTALRQNPRLHVHLHLDYNRTTRPGPASPLHALAPLVQRHPARLHVALFRSPKLGAHAAALVPPRLNEGWGTWHPKLYGADDSLLVSGANLNSSYFTNRQDRYLSFTAQPALADYAFGFLQVMAALSYRVTCSDSPSGAPLQLRWPSPSVEPWDIQSCVQQVLSRFQASHRGRPAELAGDDDVLLFPIIQGGQFNIREEERSVSMLFRHLAAQPHAPRVSLTSGYFGLYRPYQDLIIDAPIGCDILAASPKANGFYGSRGLSGLIPEGYTLLEQRFMRAVRAAGRDGTNDPSSAVRLSEWARDGWTYHAKGLWLSPSADAHPVLTLFGSTNLNARSADLDMELSFVLATSSDALRRRLHDEVRGLWRWAVPWQGAERRVRWRTRAIVGLVSGML